MGNGWRRAVCLFAAVTMLTGCWDRRELEERTSVVAIAVDAVPGKEELYRVTVQIPIPIKIIGSGGKGGGTSENVVKIMSVTGRTMLDAMSNLQRRLNQRLFIGHTRVLAISEEVARKGMRHIMDSFRRDPQIRRLMWPIIVKGEASTLLKIKPKLVQVPVVYLMDLIESGSKLEIIPDQTLGDYFIQTSNKTMNPYLNYVEASADQVKWIGLAVFSGQRMVGVLNDMQSWVLLQLRNKEKGGDVVIPMPGYKGEFVTFRPHFISTKLHVLEHYGSSGQTHHDTHGARYTVELQGDIVEMTNPLQMDPKAYIQEMQKLIKQEMEKRARNLIRILQKEYRSDVLKLGSSLRAHHYHDYWKKHDWNKEFPNFPIQVEYIIKLRRLGMETQ
jgi:spore germination protein KC